MCPLSGRSRASMPIDQEYAQRRYRVFQAHDFETSGDKKTSGEKSRVCRTQMSARGHSLHIVARLKIGPCPQCPESDGMQCCAAEASRCVPQAVEALESFE